MTSQKAVSPQEKAAFFAEFNNGLHRIGRITLVLAVIMLVSVPFIVGAMNGMMPDMKGFLKGFATVGLIYIPVAIVLILDGGLGLVKVALIRFCKIHILKNTRTPLHDHVRKVMGWSNTQTVFRFAIIQIVVSMATVYALM